MSVMTVTITAEIDVPPGLNGPEPSDDLLLWLAVAQLTERDALSRYPITINREEN